MWYEITFKILSFFKKYVLFSNCNIYAVTSCYYFIDNNEKREAELLAENCELKEQLQQSKQSLVNTLRQLELSNERRKAVETAVCNKMKKYGKKVTVAKQNFKLLTNKKPTEEG